MNREVTLNSNYTGTLVQTSNYDMQLRKLRASTALNYAHERDSRVPLAV